MRFKTELSMLLSAMALFVVSTVCYSYVIGPQGLGLALKAATYPYRAYAIPFLTFGSVIMGIATFSYSKRSKDR